MSDVEQTSDLDENFFELELSETEKAVVEGRKDITELSAPDPEPDVSADEPGTDADNTNQPAGVSDEGSGDPEGDRQQMVPHQALHQEREKRREAQERLQDMEKNHAALEAKLEVLNKHLGFEAEDDSDDGKIVDPDEDLFGAMKQLQERYDKLEERLQASTQSSDERAQMSDLQNAYVADVVRYRDSEASDFEHAYRHLQGNLDRELELQGYSDPEQRQQWIKSQEVELVRNAMANNKSPASIIYGLAKERGYAGPPAEGDQPAVSVANTQQKAADDKLSRIEKAQSASATLTGKGDGGKPLTLEVLAEMSDEEIMEHSELFHKMLKQASG